MKQQNHYLAILRSGWTWKMAWRDLQANRKKLLIFMSAIVLGVAAQVAIMSFKDTLNQTVDEQAKDLLGADIQFEKRMPFTAQDSLLIDSVSSQTAGEIRFASMVYQKGKPNPRLSQIRALEGPFPFYGSLQTTPAGGFENFEGSNRAVVDESLLMNFDAEIGDSVWVGSRSYQIVATLDQVPGEAAVVSVFGPRVYVPMESVRGTNLLARGSRVEYRIYSKFKAGITTERIIDRLRSYRESSNLRYDTVEERKEDFGEAIGNMAKFLSMIGFIALVLGGIGVASSINVYIKNKISTVAILHCVGASSRQTLTIFLVQAVGMGLIGALAGCLIGLGIQFSFPAIFSEFLPVDVGFYFSVEAFLIGLSIGVIIALAFALPPLLAIRRVSPLYTLRSMEENLTDLLPKSVKYGLYGSIFGLIGLYAWFITENIAGLYFAVGIAVSFLILIGVAKGIIWLIRQYFPSGWSYIWRQGLANLYRPNNQTVSLMLSLGLGMLLISTMYLSQEMLLSQLQIKGSESLANLVFFDIQSDQAEPLRTMLAERDMPVIQEVPIVTMQLQGINGRSISAIKEDTTSRAKRWALGHEYRVTYRDTLVGSESIAKGEWIGSYDGGLNGTVPVSLAENVFEDLDVTLGDTLTFDVQGLPVNTVIKSTREVDWERVQPNFLVLFPSGVLEPAPKIYVTVTKAEDAEQLSAIQQEVVSEFPNVSAINLQMILNTVQTFLDKISFAIQFMALFSIATGLIVLIGSVTLSRYQRIRESVLLKTLGAKRKQIVRILGIEYFFLGSLAALSGLVIALLASWLLGYFYFDIVFAPNPLTLIIGLLGIATLTVLVGMFTSRDIYKRTPLEVLRMQSV